MKDNSGSFFITRKERQEDLARRVDRAQNFDEIFELVKRVVEEELGAHRAGLSLVLANMPSTVGAYHPVGANIIVVNKSLINGMQAVTKNPKEINAFVFMILLHEYLHSLGYLDEVEVRRVSQRVSSDALGPIIRASGWRAQTGSSCTHSFSLFLSSLFRKSSRSFRNSIVRVLRTSAKIPIAPIPR